MKLRNKKFKGLFSRPLLTAVLALFLIFSPVFNVPKADAWMAVPSQFVKQALEVIYDTTQGIVMGAGKKMAMIALDQEISFMLSGSTSGGAMFIVNWQDYLVDQPEQKAGQFLNDRLSQMTRGRGSLSSYISSNNFKAKLFSKNYEGVGPGSFALGASGNNPAYAEFIATANASGITSKLESKAGNYLGKLVEGTKDKILNKSIPQVTYNGEGLFSDGTFKNAGQYASVVNDPWSIITDNERYYEEKKAEQEKIAASKAGAGGGFIGKEKDGMTITPGKLIGDITAKAKTMSMDIISSADKLPEIITTFVVTKTLEAGIGSIQSSVHKEIQTTRTNVANQVNSAAQQIGPAALFDKTNQ